MAQVEFLPEESGEQAPPPTGREPHRPLDASRIAALAGWGIAVVLLAIAPFRATIVVTLRIPGDGLRAGALANGWDTLGAAFPSGVHLDRFGIALYGAAGLLLTAIAATLLRRETIARMALVVAPSVLVGIAATMGIALQTYLDEFAQAGADGHGTSARYGACIWLTIVATLIAIAASVLAFLGTARDAHHEFRP